MAERGVIRHIDAAKQLNDFSGLRWGNITPTDIDGFVEFRGKLFVLFELKFRGKQAEPGQQLAFERLVDGLFSARLPAVLIYAEHQASLDQSVDAASAVVVRYRHHGKWIEPKISLSLREAIDGLRGLYLGLEK